MHRFLVATLLSLLPATAPAQHMQVFSVGSGDLAGNYYATANAICDRMNRNPDLPRLRCSPEPSLGSIYNLAMLASGEQDFAIAQSDWQGAAWAGSGVFEQAGPQTDLRSVMSLYPETVTVLAGAHTDIRLGTDLLGKRIEIGLPSSGRHATVVEMLRRLELGPDTFADVSEMSPTVAIEALCEGRIDATFLVVGHPDGLIAEAIDDCGARLVPLDGQMMRDALSATEEFQPDVIPAGTYSDQIDDVGSWSVYATIVTRAGTPDRVVRAFVATVLENRDWLGRRVPVLSGLDTAAMQTRALTAPLHPAAEAAFAAAGGQ